ncbi:MAG TPA: hypothetical protein VK821_16115 [Dehalococcoidia bacterium]|nr:hypothetical protein [Dehalococcoidia bacterium]
MTVGSSVTQRILSFHAGRRLAIAVAGLVLLGAIAGSAARPPSASAQCYLYSCGYGSYGYGLGGYGYGLGGYSSLGYNSYGYNPYSYGYNSYGYNPYSYGYNNYGYNPYSYGYNNYGYNNYGSSNYGYSPYTYGYNGYSNYSSPVYYQNATTYSTTTAAPTYVTRQYAVSGMYCTDKSGGMIWQPAGSPPDSALSCGGGTTAISISGGSSSSVVGPASGGTGGTAYP